MRYVIYAREFGWTPDQVDNLPLALEPWMLTIHHAIEADRHSREAAATKSGKP